MSSELPKSFTEPTIEGITVPEISALLEPLDPEKILEQTSRFHAALDKLSDIGWRTKRDKLEKFLGVLGWSPTDNNAEFDNDVITGWNVFDETPQFSAGLISSGVRARNPRSWRFDIPGLPVSSISVSTFDHRNPDPNLIITYSQSSTALTQYEIRIRYFKTEDGEFTGINCGKKDRGIQREMVFRYRNALWNGIDLAQTSIIDSKLYDAIALLSQDLQAFNRSKLERPEIKDTFARRLRDRAKSIKQLIKATSIEDKELETYGEWVVDEEPRRDTAIRRLLELTSMSPREINICIRALYSGSNRTISSMGRVTATISVKHSSGDNKNTKFMPPIIDDQFPGGANALRTQWKQYAGVYTKDNAGSIIRLENHLSSAVFQKLAGIKLLIKNGIDFTDEEEIED